MNGIPGANRTHDLRHVGATSYHLNHGNMYPGVLPLHHTDALSHISAGFQPVFLG